MGQELPFAKRGVDYPIAVHVYGVHVRPDCTYEGRGEEFCVNFLLADITSNGRKLELRSGDLPEDPYKKTMPLSLGDTRARLLKNASGTELGDGYELLLPNNRVLKCVVSGIVE
jgi:hypothetical protein